MFWFGGLRQDADGSWSYATYKGESFLYRVRGYRSEADALAGAVEWERRSKLLFA